MARSRGGWWWLGFALFFLGTSPAFALVQARLHVLVVADSNARNIGPGCSKAPAHLKQVLDDAKPYLHDYGYAFDYTWSVLTGAELSSDGLRQRIEGLQIDPQSNFLFYFCGHGATSPKAGHFLTISNDANEISRQELRKMLFAKLAKGTLIFTDSCANWQEMGRSPAEPASNYSAFADLFLNMRGTVDINAASPGQKAWHVANEGGVFTFGLLGLMSANRTRFGSDPAQPIPWDKAYLKLKDMVDGKFNDLKNSARPDSTLGQTQAQTVSFFNLPVNKVVYVHNGTGEPLNLEYRYGIEDLQAPGGVQHFPADAGQKIPMALGAQDQAKYIVDQTGNAVRVLYFQWWAQGQSGKVYGAAQTGLGPAQSLQNGEFAQIVSIIPGATD